MSLEPKQRFKQSEYAKTWQDVADSARFQEAVSAALLQMQMTLNNAQDMSTAASYHFRMEGAKQFLTILMGLTEPTPERILPRGLNLDHHV